MKCGAMEDLKRVMEIPLISDRRKALAEWEAAWTACGTIDVKMDRGQLDALPDEHHRQAQRGAYLSSSAHQLLSGVAKDPTLLAVVAVPGSREIEHAVLGVALLRWRLPEPKEDKPRLVVVPK